MADQLINHGHVDFNVDTAIAGSQYVDNSIFNPTYNVTVLQGAQSLASSLTSDADGIPNLGSILQRVGSAIDEVRIASDELHRVEIILSQCDATLLQLNRELPGLLSELSNMAYSIVEVLPRVVELVDSGNTDAAVQLLQTMAHASSNMEHRWERWAQGFNSLPNLLSKVTAKTTMDLRNLETRAQSLHSIASTCRYAGGCIWALALSSIVLTGGRSIQLAKDHVSWKVACGATALVCAPIAGAYAATSMAQNNRDIMDKFTACLHKLRQEQQHVRHSLQQLYDVSIKMNSVRWMNDMLKTKLILSHNSSVRRILVDCLRSDIDRVVACWKNILIDCDAAPLLATSKQNSICL